MADRSSRTLVIGIGNPDKGDDGAGCFVARRIAAAKIADTEVKEHRAELSLIIPYLAEAGRAFLVDASVSGAAPGTDRRFDAGVAPLPAVPRKLSAHGLDLGEAIELARVLGHLPSECVVYAIEAGQCNAGRALTPAVEQAVFVVAEKLLAEIKAGRRTPLPV